MIKIEHLTKTFTSPRGKISVFEDFSLTVRRATFLGVAGKSGSGKSTLLSMLAGLQKPTSGTILIGEEGDSAFPPISLFSLSDRELSAFRNAHIGFVSQEQSFLENLSVLDNVRLPYFLGAGKHDKAEAEFSIFRANELLESLGIAHLKNCFPRDLSGGENHRLLIARALMNNPRILLADEPTESVDSAQTENIIAIFQDLAKHGKTVILVSHDERVLKSCDEILQIGSR